MLVDVVSAVVVTILAVLGWMSGAIRQVVRIVALVAVVVGVPFVSPIFRSAVFGESGPASPGIEVVCIVAAGLFIYITVAVAGWVGAKTMRWLSPVTGGLDRVGGAGLGALKAAVVVYLLAVLVVMIEEPLSEWDPDDGLGIGDSRVAGFVADYNVLAPWQFPDLERLHRALEVGRLVAETEKYDVVRDRADAAEFLGDERIEELLTDEQLVDWAIADAYPMTLADRRVRKVLADDDAMELLERVNWDELREMLAEDDETE